MARSMCPTMSFENINGQVHAFDYGNPLNEYFEPVECDGVALVKRACGTRPTTASRRRGSCRR
eukprot:14650579-Heterocapsa_arctica.AAC.1